MNYKGYLDKKDKGLSEIVEAGGGFAIAFKKFNVENGEAEAPEIQAVDLDRLAEIKASLLKEIEDVDQVVADCNALTA